MNFEDTTLENEYVDADERVLKVHIPEDVEESMHQLRTNEVFAHAINSYVSRANIEYSWQMKQWFDQHSGDTFTVTKERFGL